jgi:hypothetical protein
LACCVRVEPSEARIVRIRDTKHVDLMYVTEPALAELLATGRAEVIRPLGPIDFDQAGMFTASME